MAVGNVLRGRGARYAVLGAMVISFPILSSFEVTGAGASSRPPSVPRLSNGQLVAQAAVVSHPATRPAPPPGKEPSGQRDRCEDLRQRDKREDAGEAANAQLKTQLKSEHDAEDKSCREDASDSE